MFIDKYTSKHYRQGDIFKADSKRAAELKGKGFLSDKVGASKTTHPLDSILEQNVEEVIDALTIEIPKEDLENLLKIELENKGRKMVKEHIESLLKQED